MGRRTGKEPDSSDTFLMRICHALDETPQELAKSIGVKYKADIFPLLGPRNTVAEMERDDTWFLISEYVAKKMGYLMAVRMELDKALQQDRARRAVQVNRLRNYHATE